MLKINVYDLGLHEIVERLMVDNKVLNGEDNSISTTYNEVNSNNYIESWFIPDGGFTLDELKYELDLDGELDNESVSDFYHNQIGTSLECTFEDIDDILGELIQNDNHENEILQNRKYDDSDLKRFYKLGSITINARWYDDGKLFVTADMNIIRLKRDEDFEFSDDDNK